MKAYTLTFVCCLLSSLQQRPRFKSGLGPCCMSSSPLSLPACPATLHLSYQSNKTFFLFIWYFFPTLSPLNTLTVFHTYISTHPHCPLAQVLKCQSCVTVSNDSRAMLDRGLDVYLESVCQCAAWKDPRRIQ